MIFLLFFLQYIIITKTVLSKNIKIIIVDTRVNPNAVLLYKSGV